MHIACQRLHASVQIIYQSLSIKSDRSFYSSIVLSISRWNEERNSVGRHAMYRDIVASGLSLLVLPFHCVHFLVLLLVPELHETII